VSSLRRMSRDFRWGHPAAVPATAPRREPERPVEVSTAWARTPLARGFRAIAQGGVLAPLVRAEVSLTVVGLERLARLEGEAAVLMANHASHLDTAALLTALPAPVRARTAVLAAADYFFTAWWKAAGTALVFGTVPIERRGGTATTAPGELLADGWNLVVFPEGTRSPDGWPTRFRPGGATLALAAGAPILPVAVRGSYAAMPRGRSWPAPGRPQVRIAFGDPVRPRPEEDARALTLRVQDEVARLLEEDRSDWWSSLRRAAADERPALTGPPADSWRRSWEASRPVEPAPAPTRHVWS